MGHTRKATQVVSSATFDGENVQFEETIGFELKQRSNELPSSKLIEAVSISIFQRPCRLPSWEVSVWLSSQKKSFLTTPNVENVEDHMKHLKLLVK